MTEQLIQDIHDRLEGIGEAVSEDRIRNIVSTYLDELTDDSDFVRKMRFGPGSGPDAQLLGTKFARWGLTLADVEWLYDVQDSLRGLRRVNGGGVYQGPSEELENTFRADQRGDVRAGGPDSRDGPAGD